MEHALLAVRHFETDSHTAKNISSTCQCHSTIYRKVEHRGSAEQQHQTGLSLSSTSQSAWDCMEGDRTWRHGGCKLRDGRKCSMPLYETSDGSARTTAGFIEARWRHQALDFNVSTYAKFG